MASAGPYRSITYLGTQMDFDACDFSLDQQRTPHCTQRSTFDKHDVLRGVTGDG